MRQHRVDEIRGNQYMGTEYVQQMDGYKSIFLMSNEVSLKKGDTVEIDDKGNVYKDKVMILDKEKKKAEMQAWVKMRKKELSGV